MTTKEAAQICGVTEECVRQNAQNNNVNASEVVKTSSKTVLGEGHWRLRYNYKRG